MSKYICANCNHDFKQKSHYIRHCENKKTPCRQIVNILTKNDIFVTEIDKDNNKKCNFCNKIYCDKYKLIRHYTTCKKKKEQELIIHNKKEGIENNLLNKLKQLEQEINILKTSKKTSKISKKNIVVEKLDIINDNINKITKPGPINEKLINMVMQKDTELEELKPKKKLVNIIDDEIDNKEITNSNILTLNNVVIISRNEDN